jgi:NAD(P)-dependent dehydrogenase (short-subunit alcohol dehydrogenase family)
MSLGISRLFDVSGKTAVVTGGSKGIGAMIAQGFVENGVKTYIVARDAEVCREAAERLSKQGTCISIAADLGDVHGIKALAAEIAAKEKKLHILINNAGFGHAAPVDEYAAEDFDRVMAINARTPFFLTQALLPLLRDAATAEDPARVVNMSSGAGLRPLGKNNFSYGASKAAEIQLSLRLALALAADNINVNVMTPGRVKTAALARFQAATGQDLTSNIPSRRLSGAEEMAGTVLYLCSRAGANTTGIVLSADGGQSIWTGE